MENEQPRALSWWHADATAVLEYSVPHRVVPQLLRPAIAPFVLSSTIRLDTLRDARLCVRDLSLSTPDTEDEIQYACDCLAKQAQTLFLGRGPIPSSVCLGIFLRAAGTASELRELVVLRETDDAMDVLAKFDPTQKERTSEEEENETATQWSEDLSQALPPYAITNLSLLHYRKFTEASVDGLFSRLPRLQSLSLMFSIAIKGSFIACLLRYAPALRTFSLLTPAALEDAAFERLSEFPNLHTLTIHGFRLQGRDLNRLHGATFASTPTPFGSMEQEGTYMNPSSRLTTTLTTLSLCRCRLQDGPVGGGSGAEESSAHAISRFVNLTDLSFAESPDLSATTIAAMLSSLPRLTRIDGSQNESMGLTEALTPLTKMRKLTDLKLEFCKMQAAGCAVLSRVAPLSELSLKGNPDLDPHLLRQSLKRLVKLHVERELK